MATVTGIATHSEVNAVFLFVLSVVPLVLLGMNVGHATDQLTSRKGPSQVL